MNISSRAYDVNDPEFIREKELQRLRAQALLFWEKEVRKLRSFGLRDGMLILEVGSGPGFITEQLLRMLPHSSVTGVEIDASLIQDAMSYLHKNGFDRFELTQASIMDSHLPIEHFDFALARLVFQHLPDPEGAARQILKTLKPGGKLVVADIDLALMGIIDPLPLEYPVLRAKHEHFIAERGSNRRIGRRLWRILSAAGFENLDLELAVAHSDAAGIAAFQAEFDPETLLPLVGLGVLTNEDVEAARRMRDEFLARDPYILVPLIMVCGQRPKK
jgi:2-polyprenyl-3-methyl-5-hydroxy-6-metoxy-1,4-benzoquinol methylase